MRILGVDPGLRLTGYGCLDVSSFGVHEEAAIVEAGVLRLTTREGDKTRAVCDRLDELDRDFRELLDRLRPETVAVESLFAHYKHPATAIVMGHARGVLLLAVRRAGVTLLEFKPNAVKKSLTGNGHASKEQMQRAVQARFRLPAPPTPPDVADALAIALCASRRGAVVEQEARP